MVDAEGIDNRGRALLQSNQLHARWFFRLDPIGSAWATVSVACGVVKCTGRSSKTVFNTSLRNTSSIGRTVEVRPELDSCAAVLSSRHAEYSSTQAMASANNGLILFIGLCNSSSSPSLSRHVWQNGSSARDHIVGEPP
jgi:hypothetical protein